MLECFFIKFSNRGGMAESRTLLALHQTDAWQDMLQVTVKYLCPLFLKITFCLKELIIVISVIGAGIACLCSMIVLKILASRSKGNLKELNTR